MEAISCQSKCFYLFLLTALVKVAKFDILSVKEIKWLLIQFES
jgi:hypothetical protein